MSDSPPLIRSMVGRRPVETHPTSAESRRAWDMSDTSFGYRRDAALRLRAFPCDSKSWRPGHMQNCGQEGHVAHSQIRREPAPRHAETPTPETIHATAPVQGFQEWALLGSNQ